MNASTKAPHGFPPTDYPTWRERVEAELKGLDFDRALVTRLIEGIEVAPLYHESPDASAPPLAGTTGWQIWEERTLERAGVALGEGPTRLFLRSVSPGTTIDPATLPSGLAGLALETAAGARDRAEWLEAAQLPGDVEVRLGVDPLGTLARRGALPGSIEDALAEWEALPALAKKEPRRTTLLRVDTAPYHEAGADSVQELAIALATLNAYLQAKPAELTPAHFELSFEISQDVLMGIAKLRAARVLTAKVLAAWQLDASSPESFPLLHANTSRRMMTRYDPWVNVLRGTNAVFAAAVGGADSIVCRPYDELLGEPSEAGLRLARNAQLVLLREGQVGRVVDPARGSYAIESLTDALARRAWEVFQELERGGGMAEALTTGRVHSMIQQSAAARAARIATLRQPITGVSEYPLTAETLPERPARPVVEEEPSDGTTVMPLTLQADAAPFERLRDATRDDPPLAFLACLGPRAEHGPRTTWTHNLLLAGGFVVRANDGTGDASPEEAARAVSEALRESGASIVCLCASEGRQTSHGEAAVRALAESKPKRLVWAGRPDDREEALRAAGVTDFLFAGDDVLEKLEALLAATGIDVAEGAER